VVFSLISDAIVTKIFSTLVELLADVSKYGNPSASAKSWWEGTVLVQRRGRGKKKKKMKKGGYAAFPATKITKKGTNLCCLVLNSATCCEIALVADK
jgi:hypothetical protein